MAVPEAAVRENNNFPSWQHYIRPAGQIARVEPEAQSLRMQMSSNHQLRFGIPAANASHHP